MVLSFLRKLSFMPLKHTNADTTSLIARFNVAAQHLKRTLGTYIVPLPPVISNPVSQISVLSFTHALFKYFKSD